MHHKGNDHSELTEGQATNSWMAPGHLSIGRLSEEVPPESSKLRSLGTDAHTELIPVVLVEEVDPSRGEEHISEGLSWERLDLPHEGHSCLTAA